MNLIVIYNVFVRDFRKQKKRITLTLVALAWGTISIMLLLGFGEGLYQQLPVNRKGLGEDIVILWAGSTTIPYKGLPKGRNLSFESDDIAYLKATMPELKEVAGEHMQHGIELKYGANVVSDHLCGITPNFEIIRNHIPQMGGRMINELDMQLKRRVVFLGDGLKERLFGDEDALGKTMYVQGMPFTVIGVMQHKMQMGSYGGMDVSKASIPLTTFEAAFGRRHLNNIIYVPHDVSRVEEVEKRVFEVMGAKKKFDPADDNALFIWDTVSGSKEFNNILKGLRMFLGIIGGLTLLIAGVGVANIMYVSIKERTREIGIKMAVGARRSYILVQFLVEALIITFAGGLAGMAFSYIVTEAFKRLPMQSDILDFMGRPTISFEIGAVVIIILGVMGLVSGFFPALKASSVKPVESLRYE